MILNVCPPFVFCLGTTDFKISHDGLDNFTWPLGQAQCLINFFVERLRSGGPPDMNNFTVVPFRCGSDAHMVGQPLPDGHPAISDPLATQTDAYAVQNMICQDCYEQMTV